MAAGRQVAAVNPHGIMIPDRTKTEFFRTNINFVSGGDTFKVALLKETTEYSPDQTAHEFVNDVLDGGTTGAEFDDTNYTRKLLSGQSVTEDNTDNEGVWDASNLTWQSLGGSQSIEAILIYKQIGGDDTTPGDDPIIRILDDSEEADLPLPTNGGDVTISWNSEGIINIA